MLTADAVFRTQLDAVAANVETLLDRLLAPPTVEGENMRPARLLDAMRYASLGGGKRLRPFLVVASGDLFGVPHARSLMTGAALECVHCYSLVHDDLPAMDDDALRRGRPTVHKAFDEATAILVGDSLVTYAFDILGRPETHPDAGVRIALVTALARASGLGGMAGGQMLDLDAEGRFAARRRPFSEDEVATLQGMKTGALIRFACRAGAILGEASDDERAALDRYGTAVGRAFQIADDLLDLEGDAATLGKATRKDISAGKATLVGVLGAKNAKARLASLVAEAQDALAPFGDRAATLRACARYVAQRSA